MTYGFVEIYGFSGQVLWAKRFTLAEWERDYGRGAIFALGRALDLSGPLCYEAAYAVFYPPRSAAWPVALLGTPPRSRFPSWPAWATWRAR